MFLKSIHIIIYLSVLIDSYSWFQLSKNYLTERYKNISNILCSSVLFLAITIKMIAIENITDVYSLAIIIFTMFIVKLISTILLYKNSIIEKIFYNMSFLLVSLICTTAMTTFFVVFMKSRLEELNDITMRALIMTLLSKAILYLVVKLFIDYNLHTYIINTNYKLELLAIINIAFVLMSFSTSVYSDNNIYIYDTHRLFFIIIMGLVLILGIVFRLTFKIIEEFKENVITNKRLSKLESETEYLENISDTISQFKSLKHDINNHIGILYGLIHAKQYDDLKKYIDNMYKDIDVSNDFVATSNSSLSILLTNKKRISRKKGISFDIELMVTNIPMEDFDIIVVLGNILDNAIEASETIKTNPYIDVSIWNDENNCNIVCKNSYNKEPIIENNTFKSLKSPDKIHGLGLDNIHKTVKKYNGNVEIKYKNCIFCIVVSLPIYVEAKITQS